MNRAEADNVTKAAIERMCGGMDLRERLAFCEGMMAAGVMIVKSADAMNEAVIADAAQKPGAGSA